MLKNCIWALVLIVACGWVNPISGWGQDNKVTIAQESSAIKALLEGQAQCWNNQDLEGFMEGYWNSEQMTFAAGGKFNRGWQATLDRYRKSYPPEKMGKLKFNNLEVTLLSDTAAMVLGEFHLTFTDQTTSQGNFSLVLRKLPVGWRVIHDHSSSLLEEKADK